MFGAVGLSVPELLNYQVVCFFKYIDNIITTYSMGQ